jgi:hypothetical protein
MMSSSILTVSLDRECLLLEPSLPSSAHRIFDMIQGIQISALPGPGDSVTMNHVEVEMMMKALLFQDLQDAGFDFNTYIQ